MSNVIVIPARLESNRLPRKMLLDLAGQSIIERSYKQACKAQLIDEVHIATDSQEILDHCKKFTENVHMTSVEHRSGTDRIAELAKKNPQWNIIINVQGDEPFINPNDIDKALEPFLHDPILEMTSLFHFTEDEKEIQNPNNVKVVTDTNSNALYFSRATIPHNRDKDSDIKVKKHIGLYAYRRETLLKLSELAQSKLEKLEKLEQLRALENGIEIKMLEALSKPIGIDTEEDFEEAKLLLN